MADFDDWDADGGVAGSDGADPGSEAGAGAIQGGLLDPRTFPARRDPAVTDSPVVDPQAPEITGPLMTDPRAEMLQDILNAQAKLPPVAPHAETWSVNGQPYLAIAARGFDPTRSSGVTSMPTPEDSAAAVAGLSLVAVPRGNAERGGYIAHRPSRVVPVRGRAGGNDDVDTYQYSRPTDSPPIHGHIDSRSDGPFDRQVDGPSEGFVDNTEQFKGYGDTDSLSKPTPVPTATVSHGQVGWHVLDNGQLKFLYPAGTMTP